MKISALITLIHQGSLAHSCFFTSTPWSRPRTCSSGARTAPSTSRVRRGPGASIEVPFERDDHGVAGGDPAEPRVAGR